MKKAVEFFRQHLKTTGGVESFIKHLMQVGQQNVHTPFDLCYEIIKKLTEYTKLGNKKIAVLFNIEFLHVLINEFGVKCDNITMFADDQVEFEFCRLQYKMKPGVNLFLLDIDKCVQERELYIREGKVDMKSFSVVCANPPYQPPEESQKNRGKTIWDKFVQLSWDICEDNGYLCLVHPSKWRCPEDGLHNLMFVNGQINYLEIHNKQEGTKTFGVVTRYDWHVLQKRANNGVSRIRFEDGEVADVRLSQLPFLPNFAWSIWEKSINLSVKVGSIKAVRDQRFNPPAKNKKELVVISGEDKEHKYPLVKSINSEGATFYWSREPHPLQEVTKILFSNGEYIYPLFDDGQYGVCEGAIYILVNKKDAQAYITFLNSKLAKLLIKSTKWNNFRTDDAIFGYMPNPIAIGITGDSTERDIYNCFNLNEKQIKYIEDNC